MTITIPMWLLWVLGIGIGVPALVVILALAVIGFVVAKALSKAGFWR